VNGVRFVGRKEELDRIEQYATVWNTSRILLVTGPGGIGKSRLLEEVYQRRQTYLDLLRGRLRTTRVVNLDDMSFQIPLSLARRIATELGAARFDSYLNRTDEIILLESKGILTPDALRRSIREADGLFLQAFGALAREERVILLLDTLGAILPLPVGRFLTRLVTQLDNTLVLLAGRNGKEAEEAKKMISSALIETRRQDAVRVDYLELGNLDAFASKEYLAQTPVASYLEGLPALQENLLLLTEGRPLLLGLAAEWLKQNVAMPELTEYTPHQLRSLPEARMAELRKKFEEALVSHISNLRGAQSELILNMAHFHLRFDAELLSAISKGSIEQSAARIEALAGLFFVKKQPDERLVLHDEMQRLVVDIVWPTVDPFGTRRKELSNKAVSHYQQRLAQLDDALEAKENDIRLAESQQDMAHAAEARRDYLTKKRLQWTLMRELLHYTLDADLAQGCQLFANQFDAASAQSQFSARTGFVQEIEQYVARLPCADKFEVSTRIARYHFEEAEYREAKELLSSVARTSLTPLQRINVLTQLANTEIRLGDFPVAVAHFEEAIEQSRKEGLASWLIRATNGLGWVYRLIGDRDRAIKHYQEALTLCLDNNILDDYGWVLNNIAFVLSYRDRRSAIAYGLAAIEHWHAIGNKVGLGAAYGALGIVYYQAGIYDESLSYYQKALDIFEPDYQEWMATIYSWRGALYQDLDRMEDAERDLLRALEIGPTHIEAMTLNRLGRVYMSRQDWQAAVECMTKSYERARNIPDYLYWLGSLARLAIIAAEQKEYHRLEEFKRQLDECLQVIKSPDENSLGIAYMALGRLALGGGQVVTAIQYFKEAISLIIDYGPYAHTDVTVRLGYVAKDFWDLPVDVIRELGRQLKQYCSDKQRENLAYGAILPVLYKWATWKEPI
jgi:tetratricopeptide (TPR) repeat protein